MDALVGYTGFVGTNLSLSHKFDFCFNSKNISDSFGLCPDLLVYAGVRSEKFLANNDPEADMANIRDAFENIKKIRPKRLVHISTVDVYKRPVDVCEESIVDTEGLGAYGYDRYVLENMLREEFPDCHIIRLPGLYGEGLKKNFIYDLINLIPSMLNAEKYGELECGVLGEYYSLQPNGFYKCRLLDSGERAFLRKYFEEKGFTALNFTDSRSVFQLYNLKYLWEHIGVALENDIKLLNISVAPVAAADIYRSVKGREFENILSKPPFEYDYKTRYAELFGGRDGYIFDADFVKRDIAEYIARHMGE